MSEHRYLNTKLLLSLPFPPVCYTALCPLLIHLPLCRYDNTFELYSESERLYLFGTDDPDSHKEWVKSIAKVTSKYILGTRTTNTNSHTLVELLSDEVV